MQKLPELTRDNLQSADARLWDAWITDRLFPWSGVRYDEEYQDWYGLEPISVQWMPVPKYSENIILAFDVVEEMSEKYPDCEFRLIKVGKWYARFGNMPEHYCYENPASIIVSSAVYLIAHKEDVRL